MSLPIEKIQSLRHVVTHAYCPDGTASAMMLRYCLPQDVSVEFVQYETEVHRTLEVRPNTVFADFSPHPEQVKDFVGVDAVVLDHHRTAKDIVGEFGQLGVFGDEAKDPGVCGAVLTFREICLPFLQTQEGDLATLRHGLEEFATLAGIRDTWQRQSPRWQEACEQAAALDFWPWSYLESLPFYRWKEKLEIGPVIFQKKLKTAKKFGDGAYRFTTDKGVKVAIFEGLKLSSDVAEYLHTEVDLVIGFDIFLVDGTPSMVFSTRSHTSFDCAAFCKAHGGGGHTRAAGFSRPLTPDDPQPFELARRILASYEQSA
jgi:oligoribonuclease NrnB/cAMP/cGMP phosphodiesterase (DHH superfamily)